MRVSFHGVLGERPRSGEGDGEAPAHGGDDVESSEAGPWSRANSTLSVMNVDHVV